MMSVAGYSFKPLFVCRTQNPALKTNAPTTSHVYPSHNTAPAASPPKRSPKMYVSDFENSTLHAPTNADTAENSTAAANIRATLGSCAIVAMSPLSPVPVPVPVPNPVPVGERRIESPTLESSPSRLPKLPLPLRLRFLRSAFFCSTRTLASASRRRWCTNRHRMCILAITNPIPNKNCFTEALNHCARSWSIVKTASFPGPCMRINTFPTSRMPIPTYVDVSEVTPNRW